MSSATGRSRARVAPAALLSLILLVWAASATAQNGAALRAAFEGHRVTLRTDMPGTSDGIDLKVGAYRPIDLSRYQTDLKKYGTAIHAGEAVVVTLAKMKRI